MAVRVFGIRHHGPGSARSLRAALDDWRPDAVLVEGPPEGEAVLDLAGDEDMVPPVALLVYRPDEPRRALFYPLAAFSPEWQALAHAREHHVPVQLVDLPAAAFLAGEDTPDAPPQRDPLAALAAAAGYDDTERWWEDLVELRRADVFDAVTEAMVALREHEPPAEGREAKREAWMRKQIRASVKAGHERVAVVCGAWHVPALLDMPAAAADARELKGLPRAKVAATWVPWTARRLTLASGYGAGVGAPGWYHHLFTTATDVVPRWLVATARLLREEDLDASSASVIEAVRLAETLAAIRDRPAVGLDECTDATQAVLAGGSSLPLALVARRLLVGEDLGRVPDDTPMVPLATDLAREQRRLRLPAKATTTELDLDLRKPNHLARSHLLHRLLLLGVRWGTPARDTRGAGTFRETWEVTWQPELSVQVIEASMWGTTVAAAATARARHDADEADALRTLTALVEQCLLADLPDAVSHVMAAVADRAALDTDTGHLMDALGPLARVLRYGNVRRTDTAAVAGVVDGLVARVCVGLPPACSALADDAAEQMLERLAGVHDALATLDRADLSAQWYDALARLADQRGLHGLLAGRCWRLLVDAGRVEAGEATRRLSAVLSTGEDPARAAAWIEGFLAGSGLVLLHDRRLLAMVDAWVARVAGDTFTDLLPLLRRTFSGFTDAERRQVGEAVRRLDASAPAASGDEDEDLNHERAAAALPAVARLLGLQGSTR